MADRFFFPVGWALRITLIRTLSYLVEVIKRALSASTRIVPLIRAGLIAGVVVAAASYPLGSRRRAFRPRRCQRPRFPAQFPDHPAVGANDVRLCQRRQDPPDRVLPGGPHLHADRQDVARTSNRRSWPPRTRRFYDHHGVDIRGVARAFVANDQAGGVSQGASTLTMQYVRNALRDGADDARRTCSTRPRRPTPASSRR